ncbi:MAG: UDP-N-acetylmuramoyl-L-alanine--D-glutamate ligase [Betaproteobacteria bacterium]|nr:UDP-N-acetylmuramoyl-L-alanine--D-glutamate ligase [Betaproteobacteria bacterium]
MLILGLGDSGLAMARWCAWQGAEVTVVDTRSAPPGLAALQAEGEGLTFKSQAFHAQLLEDKPIHGVFKSPGLRPTEVAPVWQAAIAKGIWVGTELSLFAHAMAHLKSADQAYQPHVLAITGTNGKTTVTRLTGLLLERAGKSVAIAGNIGPTMLDTLRQRWESLPDTWVLELSSFQLDGVTDFEPTAACLLNITQDHLDWHGEMRAYAQAKSNVWGRHSIGILPRHDAKVMDMWPSGNSAKKAVPRARISFGPDEPQTPGDFGLSAVNGMTWLVRAAALEEPLGKRAKLSNEPLHIQRLMPADALRIRGQHNALNALAALALASTCSSALAPLLHGLREYPGEPHRVSSVCIVNDIEYIDDSKGTNVGATVAAINSLGADRQLVVILGGESKGQDFSPLIEPVTRHVRAVVLMGRDAERVAQALRITGVEQHQVDDMTDAVNTATACAQAGDVVLLSPACASLDMYENYVARAHAFEDAVRLISSAKGNP